MRNGLIQRAGWMRPAVAAATGGLLMALALPVSAAQDVPRQRRGAPGGAADTAGDSVDEELGTAIERLMVQRFTSVLDLSEAQAGTVVPMMKNLTALRREHARRRIESLRTLAALAQDSSAEEGDLSQRLQAFDEEQAGFLRDEIRIHRELRAQLNPRQEARLLGFEERFREEMRGRIEDIRRRGSAGERRRPRPQRPAPRRP